MSKFTNYEKISLIKKYYKKNPFLFELNLINYEKCNIYICINEIDKNDSYRISWFYLDDINDKSIEKYISCEYISPNVINTIKEDFSKLMIDSYNEKLLTDEFVVELKMNIATKENKSISATFKKYLPEPLYPLVGLIYLIFQNMPNRYETFLWELLARYNSVEEKYEYKQEFDFDLFKGDIDKLFSPQICERGKKYYKESRVVFLEKIDDRYFSVVEGTEDYLTIIRYDEGNKKMQVYCSCPCEFYCKHMYAVILAIRNNEFNRFYKIMYKNPNKDLIDRILDLDYYLCLGVVEQNLEIINSYGEFELVPILDKNGEYNWQVLEDSEDEKLMKEIKCFLDNN